MKDRLGDRVRLLHIYDAIKSIEEYTFEADETEFSNNSMMYNATLKQLETIGEAANRLSDELINNYQDVPWYKMIRLRNLIIHEYFSVDNSVIWNIVKINLPELKLIVFDLLQKI